MITVKLGTQQYPATVRGRVRDGAWDDRQSMEITLTMSYETALSTFVDGLTWSVCQTLGDRTMEYDYSDYDVAGAITDHRDGRVSVKMGKITDAEALAELMEVLA